MKDAAAVVGILVLVIGLIVGLAFGGPWVTLQVKRLWGTELQSVETDIYRENKSYVEGTIRDLREMQVEYSKADDSQREALASLVLHRANELDWERLPGDVRDFLNELRDTQ